MFPINGEDRRRVFKEFDREFLNTFRDHDDFIEAMLHNHRTLQQNFTRLCFDWLKALAAEEHYDLRNEASVKFAREVMDKVESSGFPHV